VYHHSHAYIGETFSNLYTLELSSLDIEHKTMSALSQLTPNQRRGPEEFDVVFNTLFDADRVEIPCEYGFHTGQ